MQRFYLLVLTLFALILSCPVEAKPSSKSSAPVHVNGYTRKDGTYVAPYTRSAPNGTKADNYSTKGAVNPYTVKEGTKKDDSTPSAVSGTAQGAGSTDTAKPAETQAKPEKPSLASVRPGMTQAEVKTVLGEPNMQTKTRWIYSGVGKVTFGDDGKCLGVVKN